MADAHSNLILEHLRRIRATLDDMRDDIRVLKVRSSAVETHLAAMNHRIDSFDVRLGRIEHRLDLVEV